ncbi:MAG: DUF4142 domain-containing protein [Verrucomicrobiota bacterium]|nr:DUF4142 domain-containing protein [Verrucomicrobiota bacterium]
MNKQLMVAFVAGCLTFSASISRAEDKPKTAGTNQLSSSDQKSKVARKDSKFVRDAAQGGAMEVDLGKLGVEKAQNPAVKQFAQRIVDDHTKANQELTKIVEQKGIKLAEPSKKESKMTGHLRGLSGAEFDRAYLQHMVKDHEKDIKAFEKTAESSEDSQIKEFASKTLPTLKEHLSMARNLLENRGTTNEVPARANPPTKKTNP